MVTLATGFAFWLLIAAVLFLPDRGKTLLSILLAGVLALVELGSAVQIDFTRFNRYFFGLTRHCFVFASPPLGLLHRRGCNLGRRRS